MNSTQYREKLTSLLGALAAEEREDAVAFYMEAIADRIDEGMTEEAAIAAAPTPEEAAAAILLNAKSVAASKPGDAADRKSPAASGSAKQEGFWKRLKKGQLKPLEWVGLVFASPFILAAAAIAATLAVGVACIALAVGLVAAVLLLAVWILVLACWIVGVAFVVASPVCVLFAIWGLQIGDIPYTMVQLGYACFGFGTGIWVLRGCKALTKCVWNGQRKGWSAFVRACKRRWGKKPAELSGAVVHPAPAPAPQGGPVAANMPAGALFGTAPAPTYTAASVPGACAIPAPAISPDAVGSGAPGSPALPLATPSRYAAFFRVCLIMIAVGLALVLGGFLASGLNWRVFCSSLYTNGSIVLGGTVVADPRQLLFGRLFYWLY